MIARWASNHLFYYSNSKCGIYFALIIIVFARGRAVSTSTSAVPEELVINSKQWFNGNNYSPRVFVYKLDASEVNLMTANLRMETTVTPASQEGKHPTIMELECPLIFTLRQSERADSWSLPLTLIENNEASNSNNNKISKYAPHDSREGPVPVPVAVPVLLYSRGFTICLDSDNGTVENIKSESSKNNAQDSNNYLEFLVTVSTCNPYETNFSMLLSFVDTGFLLELNTGMYYDNTVSPSVSRFYRFNFPPHTNQVAINMHSTDNICMSAVVTSPWCKLISLKMDRSENETAERLNFHRVWQDMTSLAVFEITREDFPEGCFIFFEVHGTDDECEAYNGISPSSGWLPNQHQDFYKVYPASYASGNGDLRAKTIYIEIKRTDDSYSKLPLFFYPIIFAFFNLMVTLVIYRIFSHVYLMNPIPLLLHVPVSVLVTVPAATRAPVAALLSEPEPENEEHLLGDTELPVPTAEAGPENENEVSGDDENLIKVPGTTDNSWLKMDAFVHHSTTNEAPAAQNRKKISSKFHCQVLNIGIFYALPASQLLILYQRLEYITGQNDLCYRNFKCSQNLFGVEDFNHLYSNILYILFGLAFLLLVRHFKGKVNRMLEAEKEAGRGEGETGVFYHFEHFYALGVSLIFEGILSGVYHLCPTQTHFQFDSSFMYILAVLSTIQIYQFRHADPFCPHNTFGILAVISLMSVAGILLYATGNKDWYNVYEYTFCILHIFISVPMVSVYMFFVGHVRNQDNNAVTGLSIFFHIVKKLQSRSPDEYRMGIKHWLRLWFVLPFVSLNIAISILHVCAHTQSDFATYLINTFGGNTVLYFGYYFVMKIWHKELKIVESIRPGIYLLLFVAYGAVGYFFFTNTGYNTMLSPANSKAKNEPCFPWLQVFDSHDLWHFCSAAAMFFLFMILLTLDDAILLKPRTEIIAF